MSNDDKTETWTQIIGDAVSEIMKNLENDIESHVLKVDLVIPPQALAIRGGVLLATYGVAMIGVVARSIAMVADQLERSGTMVVDQLERNREWPMERSSR